MRFCIKMWRRSDPIATRLAHRLFDKAIISNQFRTMFLQEMISPCLMQYGWVPAEKPNANCEFSHSDGSRLKVMQAAARQSGSDDAMLQLRPVFQIRQLAGSSPSRPNSIPEIILIGWHPVVGLHETDHRDSAQWEFFLLPAKALPESQKTMGLPRIREIGSEQGTGPIAFAGLAGAVEGMRLRLRAQRAVQKTEIVPGRPELAAGLV